MATRQLHVAYRDGRDSLPSQQAPLPKRLSTPAAEYQRAASYTHLPRVTGLAPQPTKGTFSEHDLIGQQQDEQELASDSSSGWATPDEYDTRAYEARAAVREIAKELRKNPKISVRRFLDLNDEGASTSSSSMHDKKSSTSQESASSMSSHRDSRQRSSIGTTVSGKIRRRSGYSAATTPDSRSPSPIKKDGQVIMEEEATLGAFHEDLADLLSPIDLPSNLGRQTVAAHSTEDVRELHSSRRSSLFRRSTQRPFSEVPISSLGATIPDRRSSYIPTSFSTDRLSVLDMGNDTSSSRPASSRLGSSGRLSTFGVTSASRKRDELWSVFRALDGDYSKFNSKTLSMKANVIRSTIIPFLRDYAEHPSIHSIRAEDLDRRTNILNKWWTGLIEMLHGRHNQSVSGTDRPAILDAMSGIMDRPEWRLAPSSFCARDRRLNTSRNHSASSLTSMGHDARWETAVQNAQKTFAHNLRWQMSFVVDKMSLRSAAASLVTFCGKACAYAFMFVPGMADVLVRLWDLNSDVMRRVLAENGIDRFGNLSQLSDDILMLFPPCLHQLGFTSLAHFGRKLRTSPPLPTGTTNIQWWGYWLERWSGRESDLFYVFVKHYHILVAEFLSVGSTREERMCVPGMLPVHSQILHNLDSTIHRQSSKPLAHNLVATDGSLSIEDVLSKPDAVASPLPLVPVNAARLMAENRLIILLRDFLSEGTSGLHEARLLFAEAFNELLQAAARGVSVYDAGACYTLLDFAEEALTILVKYEQINISPVSLINADFWHLVSRRMIASENTFTEIRLYSWLYTIWNTIVSNLDRKADLCLGLLLDPAIFASRFNHWSPMVRAYYMRLLCWRVGRLDGEDMPGDFKILDTLLERLQSTWSHYLWLRELQDGDRAFSLQASPQNPAPYRRLRIIKDAQAASSTYATFDGLIAPMISPAQPQNAKGKRLSTLASVAELEAHIHDVEDAIASPSSSPSGLRSLFRSVVGNRARSKSRDRITSAERPSSLRPGLLRAATADAHEVPAGTRDSSKSMSDKVRGSSHRSFSFRFQMEHSPNIRPPPPIRLIPPRLPAPAQQFLTHFSDRVDSAGVMHSQAPTGLAKKRIAYCGRALAEWAQVVGECQSFFDRRRSEGVPENKYVETPALSIEIFKRVP